MAAGAVTVMKQRSFFLPFRGIIAKAEPAHHQRFRCHGFGGSFPRHGSRRAGCCQELIPKNESPPVSGGDFRLSKKLLLNVEVYRNAQHESLPCVRGGGPPNGGSEGLPLSAGDNPSVSPNGEPAPFTQGSLGRYRARSFFTRSNPRRLPAGIFRLRSVWKKVLLF